MQILCAIFIFQHLVFKYKARGGLVQVSSEIINIHCPWFRVPTKFVPTNSLPCSFLLMRRHFFLPPLDEQQLLTGIVLVFRDKNIIFAVRRTHSSLATMIRNVILVFSGTLTLTLEGFIWHFSRGRLATSYLQRSPLTLDLTSINVPISRIIHPGSRPRPHYLIRVLLVNFNHFNHDQQSQTEPPYVPCQRPTFTLWVGPRWFFIRKLNPEIKTSVDPNNNTNHQLVVFTYTFVCQSPQINRANLPKQGHTNDRHKGVNNVI